MTDPRPDTLADTLPELACPLCGKAMVLAYRPFCSKHCADLDLSRWLNGVYAVPATPDPLDDDDEMLAQLAKEIGIDDA
ncbi:MAG: DNA gyrase inhibitor YacG [Hyphomicrobiales bacterium]|jgi:endogenous inhibitor of DNA gyrase (YacG/DUF329 family)|nr:DNA gyrase inhibitor YacG [Hyphomicrobiales bacterium]